MNDTFERRLHAAAMAGWWTILIAGLVITFQWLLLLCILKTRPEWLLALWGPEATWTTVNDISLWAIAALKIGVLFFVMVVTWLTLWAKGLRRCDSR